MNKTFACRNHQNKASNLIEALLIQGWECVQPGQPADLLLIDHDHPLYGTRELIDAYKEQGAKIVVYPHGANPNLQYDGIYPAYEKTDCLLVPAEGHAEIMRRSEYPHPVHTIGWFYCETRPFKATAGEAILFAPMHPDGTGHLFPTEKQANADQFRALLELGKPLTVRYLGTLEQNGLWIEDGVTYMRGTYDNSIREILRHDCVVSTGSFGYMSIALGVPTVLFFQGLGVREMEMGAPKHYMDYVDYMSYPLDSDDASRMKDLMAKATAGDTGVEDWKAKFIGQALKREELGDLLTQIAYGDILEKAHKVGF